MDSYYFHSYTSEYSDPRKYLLCALTIKKGIIKMWTIAKDDAIIFIGSHNMPAFIFIEEKMQKPVSKIFSENERLLNSFHESVLKADF